MAENNAVTDFYETAPEDSEFISRIPEEIRYLRGAIRSAMAGEHVEIQTGNVVTGARHKMGAGRAYVGTYGSTGTMTGLNPAGNAISTSISSAATALADVGRFCVDVSDDYSIGVFANDAAEEGTAVWTYASVRAFQGTAVGTMYAASNSWKNLQIENNEWFVARNAADDDEVSVVKLDASDHVELPASAHLSTSDDPVDDKDIVPKAYVDQFGSAAWTPSAYTGGESVTYPNGMIEKSGNFTHTADNGIISFAAAFPTTCVNAMVCQGDTASLSFNIGCTGMAAVQMLVYNDNGQFGATTRWWARGY